MQEGYQLRMNQSLRDLNPILAGESSCTPGQIQGPVSWEHPLIHYVLSGKGVYYIRGEKHPVHAGQIFITMPGDVVSYQADQNDPWRYRWVGFNGCLADRFSELPPVVTAPEGTMENLCDLMEHDSILEYRLASELFFLYSKLLKPQKHIITSDCVKWIMDHVQASYMNPISVSDLASQLGMDRCYLTKKFKKRTNYSIQGYILHVRLTRAAKYLEEGFSVKETADMCGFNDVSSFCKSWTKYEESHQSPAAWQKFIREIRKQTQQQTLLKPK